MLKNPPKKSFGPLENSLRRGASRSPSQEDLRLQKLFNQLTEPTWGMTTDRQKPQTTAMKHPIPHQSFGSVDKESVDKYLNKINKNLRSHHSSL